MTAATPARTEVLTLNGHWRVIGHAVGGRLGQTYNVYEYVDEKRRALEAWEAHLARVVEGREAADGNVVRLAAAH